MPDILVNQPAGWVNVYSLSGFTVGTRLILQNKDGTFDPLVREQASSPAANDVSGAIMPYGLQYNIPATALGCWVRGNQDGTTGSTSININVQAPA